MPDTFMDDNTVEQMNNYISSLKRIVSVIKVAPTTEIPQKVEMEGKPIRLSLSKDAISRLRVATSLAVHSDIINLTNGEIFNMLSDKVIESYNKESKVK